MKILGVLVVPNNCDRDSLEYVPLDGSSTEFRVLMDCPAKVAGDVIALADSNNATPLGVLVDLDTGEGCSP